LRAFDGREVALQRHSKGRSMSLCRFLFAAAAAISIAWPGAVRADVKLPAIFGDNMVLQSEAKVPVWGTADPGEKVEVRISVTKSATPIAPNAAPADTQTQAKQATADAMGRWKVVLDPMPATDEAVGLVI